MIVTSELTGVLGTAVDIAMLFLIAALILTTVRLMRGPTLPDRVVALDLISMLLVAFLAIFALASDESAYLDAAVALALVAFLATVAMARFIDRSPQAAAAPERDEEA
ncbi:MAG: monovalent cation/H+ antiporter complex subunit F [Pseudomonadota bacterium]